MVSQIQLKTSSFQLNCVVLLVMLTRPTLGDEKQENYCYADDTKPYHYFGSITPYELTRNRSLIPITPGVVENCVPVQLWLICRHGARYPKLTIITNFQNLPELKRRVLSNHNAGRGSLCKKDLENLKEWQFNVNPKEAYMLTMHGRQQLYDYGKRIRSYFPKLINTKQYDPDKFMFRHTDTARTKESAEYFARGLFDLSFNDSAPKLPPPPPQEVDQLLCGFYKCPSWQQTCPSSLFESHKFRKSNYMKKVIENVSKRLGFAEILTMDNISLIYDGCRYQTAWDVSGVSPWCAAFSRDDLEVLEYSKDLTFYYKCGPGCNIGSRLSCPLVKDIFDRFSGEVSGDKEPAGVFYFSHDIAVDMLLARLGFDGSRVPLTADNFHQQKNRVYRSSFTVPFMCNILIVLYNCSAKERAKLAFFQNENKVSYAGCVDNLCDWSYIKNSYKLIVDDPLCLDSSFCNTQAPTGVGLKIHPVSTALRILSPFMLLSLYVYSTENIKLWYNTIN